MNNFTAWHGVASPGMAWRGKARHGKARQGKAGPGAAWRGKARRGAARRGEARRGKARECKMVAGNKGMGTKKHARSGRSPKSPRFRHQQKLEAERFYIKDWNRIRDPKQSVGELFKK